MSGFPTSVGDTQVLLVHDKIILAAELQNHVAPSDPRSYFIPNIAAGVENEPGVDI